MLLQVEVGRFGHLYLLPRERRGDWSERFAFFSGFIAARGYEPILGSHLLSVLAYLPLGHAIEKEDCLQSLEAHRCGGGPTIIVELVKSRCSDIYVPYTYAWKHRANQAKVHVWIKFIFVPL